MKTGFLITGLVLLLIANIVMIYTRGIGMEGFEAKKNGKDTKKATKMDAKKKAESFVNYFLEDAGASGDKYTPMGPFDNVRLVPDNGVSTWRYTAPNEPLMGPEFEVGPDNLFIFKNNQSKPECCSASYASDLGCVCTTPQQRNYINMRGGNRTMEDGV